MKQVRIGGGAGYAGDRLEPALDLLRWGKLDYLMLECLAERTIALAQLERLQNPERGYNHLLEQRMAGILPLIKQRPCKIITNMGAANPIGAADKIADMARRYGVQVRLATVLGDDLLARLGDYSDVQMMETGQPLSSLGDSIISANAYLGAGAIADALGQGADIVVTGRVADPALAVGPLMHEYGKLWDDWDFLGCATLAGHLLECAGQVTGGYFADPGVKDVPELWNLGFPILTFSPDGSMTVEKLENTGGLVSEATVKEQLLYEIQNPAAYLTPDVTADFSGVSIQKTGHQKVRASGGGGKAKSGMLKVSVGYRDGYIGEGEISYGGKNCTARARLAGEVIAHRLVSVGLRPREIRYDILGVNSLFCTGLTDAEPTEVRLRVAARTDTPEQAAVIGREVEALYTNGPAGGSGARAYSRAVVAIGSILVPEGDVEPYIVWKD